MKKLILVLIICFITQAASAQLVKIYFDVNGKQTSPANADNYYLVNKISDSLWSVKQYYLNDSLIMEGAYKDKMLSIPQGKFVFYDKKLNGEVKSADTLQYIKTEGYFENGLRTGEWIEYYSNKHKKYVNHYVNGHLEGLSEMYTYDTNALIEKGYYVNNLRQGEWDEIGIRGNIVEQKYFENGALAKTVVKPFKYKAPDMPGKFINYIYKLVGLYLSREDKVLILVRCDIDTAGRLSNSKIFFAEKDYKFKDPESVSKFLSLIPDGPIWKPAYDSMLKRNITDNVEFALEFEKGKPKLTYDKNEIAKGKVYRLTR